MVQCVKLGREAEGLDKPPLKGEIGQRVYNEVSKEAWRGWIEHSKMLINEYRLDLTSAKAHELLKPDAEVQSKRRLAFAKAHANELWQADTMFGPYVKHCAGKPRPNSSPSSTTPAASCATANSSLPTTPKRSSRPSRPRSTSAACASASTSTTAATTRRWR